MKSLIAALFSMIFAIIFIIASPVVIIWCLNALLPIAIALTWKTYFATMILSGILRWSL